MVHLIPLGDDTTALEISKRLFEYVIKYHGVPRSIVSDRDPRFTSKLWSELMTALGTQLNISTAFHP
jgi:hypothetical protein